MKVAVAAFVGVVVYFLLGAAHDFLEMSKLVTPSTSFWLIFLLFPWTACAISAIISYEWSAKKAR